MKKTSPSIWVFCLAVSFGITGISQAAIVIAQSFSTVSESAYDGNISTTDLINNGSAAVLSRVSSGTDPFGGANTWDRLTDGAAASGSNISNSVFTVGNSTITYTLNTTTNIHGYTLTGIRSIAGYNAGDPNNFTAQNFLIEVAYVASPSTFVTLIDHVYTPGSGYSSEVLFTDNTGTLAANVAALRYTIRGASNGQVIRELDIAGAASVPEPSAALLGLAAALLGITRRRR